MTLSECKDQIAKKAGFNNWLALEDCGLGVSTADLSRHHDSAAELYAKSQVNDVLLFLEGWAHNHDGPGRLVNCQQKRLIEELKKLKR